MAKKKETAVAPRKRAAPKSKKQTPEASGQTKSSKNIEELQQLTKGELEELIANNNEAIKKIEAPLKSPEPGSKPLGAKEAVAIGKVSFPYHMENNRAKRVIKDQTYRSQRGGL